ncbi:hypothetical protein V8E54_011997 [Elaphomyces granulatus]|jgi:hypothetical protein
MTVISGRLVRFLLSTCLGLIFLSRPNEAYSVVSDGTLKSLPRPDEDFDIHTGGILAPILQPRVPGTPGSTAVLNHFADFFRHSLPDWQIEFQNSTSKTPVTGDREVPFVNFIATRDPPWAASGNVGRLTLAAHYDSKYKPEGFIGAIDSAVPCAVIMHAMRSIDDALTKKWAAMDKAGHTQGSLDEHTGIQVMFLDGEEAFDQWTATDSLYGSRSLAQEWGARVNPPMSTFKTRLSSIMLFMLLDLLGSKDPKIRSYFKTTHWAYQSMATIEKRLRELKLFKSSPNYPVTENRRSDSKAAEEPQWLIDATREIKSHYRHSGIADDHLPFLERGVEVLHIIDASPITGFPTVWHTLHDDGDHLDMNTVEDWSVLITAFAAEWMELENFIDTADVKRTPSVPLPRSEKVAERKNNPDTRKTEL